MATRTWQDASSDWNDTANWSGGAVPVDNDDVVINRGSKNITSNLNQSGINLNSLNITSGFRGNIGSPGASLQISVDGASPTTFRVAMGGGYIYWSGASTPQVNIGSTGSGAFYITGGTLTGGLACGISGRCVVSSGVTISNTVYSAGCGLDISSATGSVYLMGGNHIIRANVGTTLTVGANASCEIAQPASTGVTVNTTELHSGAKLYYNTAGTQSTVTAYPGSYIQNAGAYDNTITTLVQWVGSTQVLRAPSALTTVTTTTPVGQK